MADDPGTAAWDKLAEKLGEVGYAIFNDANVPITDRGASDVKVIACTLLCRTLSNLKGPIILARAERTVEARILTRACFENLLYVGALRDQAYEFVKEMALDDQASRRARGEFLLERGYQLKNPNWEISLRSFLRKIKSGPQPRRSLTPKGIARGGPVVDAYNFYAQLSADSAHPTTDALSRYLTRLENGTATVRALDVEPPTDKEELLGTWQFACQAVLGVLVGVNEILGGTPASPAVAQAAEDYDALMRRRAVGST